jgi:disulfide bond formation protein DsbB
MTKDTLEGRLMLASAAVFAIALATIMVAHGFERIGGYLPCHLCLQERYAYYFAVPAALIAFFGARGGSIGIARVVLLAVALAFVINAALGIYHSGVEWKWWPGPTECSGGTALGFGESGLGEQLNTTVLARCDEAAWRFLGLSFAGWNAVLSALLAGIAAYGASVRR